MGTPPFDPGPLEDGLPFRAGSGRSTAFLPPEIVLFAPASLEDAAAVISAVRAGRLVLVDASASAAGVMQRLIDVCSGAVMAMDGQVHGLGEELFLFAPTLARIEEL